MDDLFNQLMGVCGYSSENAVTWLMDVMTPEEFAHYRATGNCQEMQKLMDRCHNGIRYETRQLSCKLGRNLTASREGKLDPVIGRNKKFKKHLKFFHAVPRTILFWFGDAGVSKTAVVEV